MVGVDGVVIDFVFFVVDVVDDDTVVDGDVFGFIDVDGGDGFERVVIELEGGVT